MLAVVGLMLAGVAAGALLRRRGLPWTGRAVTCLVCLLLFLMGVEVGGNPRLIGGLRALGAEALVLAAASTLGSVVAAWALGRLLRRGGRGGTGRREEAEP